MMNLIKWFIKIIFKPKKYWFAKAGLTLLTLNSPIVNLVLSLSIKTDIPHAGVVTADLLSHADMFSTASKIILMTFGIFLMKL